MWGKKKKTNTIFVTMDSNDLIMKFIGKCKRENTLKCVHFLQNMIFGGIKNQFFAFLSFNNNTKNTVLIRAKIIIAKL